MRPRWQRSWGSAHRCSTAGREPLTYDTNFNLASYDGWSYVFDAENRLTSVSGNGHNASFVYDGMNRCVQRTIDNVTTVLIYDEWKPIAEATPTGTISAWNLYGPGADEILWRNQAGIGDIHYHSDHEGNVLFLLDSQNNRLESYRYDAFGEPTILSPDNTQLSTSGVGNRFMFTGREYLSVLGIYDYRHRYYHPGLGRFLGVDPVGLQIEGAKLDAEEKALYPNGQAPEKFGSSELNLFRYCGNDPMDKVDPWAYWFRKSSHKIMVKLMTRVKTSFPKIRQ